MRAAIYARVSTTDRGQDTSNQLAELQRFASCQGWEIVEVYEDQVSGAKGRDKRPAFDRMLNDASKRRFDILLVWSADRLSRQGPYETLDVVRKLSAYGVRFRSLQQPFLDTTNGFGEVLLALFGWLASEERRLISERTKAGLKRAVAQGKTLGRRPVAVDMGRIAVMRANAASMRDFAEATGVGLGTGRVAVTSIPVEHSVKIRDFTASSSAPQAARAT
jgi:DNA invertase Pin-like site-specific DNA recombinase